MNSKCMKLAAFLLLLLPVTSVLAEDPDIILRGELTREDHQTYREIPFEVPEGIDRITVEFVYDRSQRTTVDLGLLDSERFRGWSGGNKSRFTLSETDATPSYLPGPLPAGEWKLLLGVPNLRADVISPYRAKIYFDRGTSAFTQPLAEEPLAAEAGWYRGDLHTHTGHSDGSCNSTSRLRNPCPIFQTLLSAKSRGLDFTAVTEHNTRSHHSGLRELQEYFDDMVLIPGREITTFYGHANIFGSTGYVDFRVTNGDVRALQDEVDAVGGLLSINHPGLPSGEECMGCGWIAKTDYSRVAAMEVVNGSVLDNTAGDLYSPVSGIPVWEDLLNQGYRITAIAGSDNHDPTRKKDSHGKVGGPLTVIQAENLSQPALLRGMQAGRVFIDFTDAKGSQLDILASGKNGEAKMGETLVTDSEDSVRVSVTTTKVPGAQIRLHYEGLKLQKPALEINGESRADFTIKGKDGMGWLRAELLDNQGEVLRLSNPVFLNHLELRRAE